MTFKSGENDSPITLPELKNRPAEGLYVHIPFCFHKCHYCDFYSITRQTPQRMANFVDRLLHEADYWTRPAGAGGQIRTIFFGGGTPSLLPLEQMSRLLRGLGERFDFSGVEEWTVEVNPATASLEYCEMLRSHGVNRLSFGAQSFRPADLKTLERHHDPDDVPRSLELARQAGFERANIDLIYAIPGQTLADWQATLEQAIGLSTTHLSCYGLTYEPNTPMAVKKRMGLLQPASDDLEIEMLLHTRRRLREAGLRAYEISNYATPGQACRHNLVYWTGGNYIGLGPSAASHIDGHRWKNRPHLGEWEQAIDAHTLPADDVEHLSPPVRAGELAMLMLRLETGIEYETFAQRLGIDARSLFAEPAERLAKLGYVETNERGIRLTERGIPVADAVAGEFLRHAAGD